MLLAEGATVACVEVGAFFGTVVLTATCFSVTTAADSLVPCLFQIANTTAAIVISKMRIRSDFFLDFDGCF